MNKLKIIYKYIFSFFKKDWQISDYPLQMKIQKDVPEESKYYYSILNWFAVIGLGPSEEKAFEHLNTNFNNIVEMQGFKPRPGKYQPIKIAATDIVSDHYELLEHFIINVLGFAKGDPVFISDRSSLRDFSEDEEDYKKYLEKIEFTYNLKLEVIENYKISDLLLKINKDWEGKHHLEN